MKKIVLITGSSRGIGKSILKNFFKETGAYTIISVSKTFNVYEVSLKEFCNYDLTYCIDISNFFYVKMLSKKLFYKLKFIGVDILINNGGIIKDNLILKMSANE
jgi:3-oxoacyl-[acyl-carrier protein] reductase